MKKFIKYFFLGLLIILVIIISAAVIIPFAYKGKIVDLIKQEANKSLNATLNFNNDISISVFKSFPDLTVGIKQLSIVNKAPFEGDTLVYLEKLSINLDLMKVINGDYSIKVVDLEKPYVNIHVNKDGIANYDITIPSQDTTTTEPTEPSAPLEIALKHYEIREGKVIYNDESLGFFTELKGLNHQGDGDFTLDVFDLRTQSTIDSLTLSYDGIAYLSNIKTSLKADLNIDLPNAKYSFKENELLLNNLALAFDGFIAMPTDSIYTDVSFEAKENSFKNFLSLVPVIYSKDFENLKTNGTLALKGMVKGNYYEETYPGMDILVDIKDGYFKYPDLPSAIEKVNISTHLSMPEGDLDGLEIDIPKASLELEKQPLSFLLNLKYPMSDPLVKTALKGNINLDYINKLVSLENTTIGGNLEADLFAEGRLSSIEKEQYENFKAEGKFNIDKFSYKTSDPDDDISVNTFNLSLSPQKADVLVDNLMYLQNDFTAKGKVENILGYIIKGSTLVGELSLSSNNLNINKFLTEEETIETEKTEEESSTISAPEIPNNIDFTLNSNIKKLEYDQLSITDFVGEVVVRDQKINLNKILMNVLGGSFALNGYYDGKDLKNPVASLKLELKNIDMQSTYSTLNSVKELAPIGKSIFGDFGGALSFNTSFDDQMSPVLNSITSDGVLVIDKAQIKNLNILNILADKLKLEQFREIDISGIRPSYFIADGKVSLKEPLKFKFEDIPAELIGSMGLDKTLDFLMSLDVPSSLVGNPDELLKGVLGASAESVVGKTIPVLVSIKGTSDKPIISLSMNNLKDNLKNAIQEKAKQAIDDAKKKANEEVEKKKKEAEAALNEQKEKALEEKRKAEQKTKETIDAEKKRLEEEKRKAEEEAKRKAQEEADKLKNKGKGILKDALKK